MCDFLIRNGTVVDGTGRPPFIADIAVKDGKIMAVGSNLGEHILLFRRDPSLNVFLQGLAGKEELDATGLMIAPGWIDPHSHMDAQWSWDPYVSSLYLQFIRKTEIPTQFTSWTQSLPPASPLSSWVIAA